MIRSALTAAMAAAVVVLSSQPLLAAAPKGAGSPTSTQPAAKVKTISFHLRNDSTQEMTVRGGDLQVTVAPGKSTSLKLPNGVQVISVNGSTVLQPGALIAVVSPLLEGNTLAVR